MVCKAKMRTAAQPHLPFGKKPKHIFAFSYSCLQVGSYFLGIRVTQIILSESANFLSLGKF